MATISLSVMDKPKLDKPRPPVIRPICVSVIMPAYNAERFIVEAIRSARTQSETRIEILVIDDCSSDATAALVERLAGQDARIRLIRRPVNGGPAAARNAGLDAARGEWVALLDADDKFLSMRLAHLIALGEQRGADIVSDNLLLCPDGDDALGERMIPPELLPRPRLLTTAEFVRRNVGSRKYPRVSYGFMQPIMRREFLLRHGLRYDEHNRFGEDFLLYTRCLLRGARWWVTPEAMYLYNVRGGSLTEVQTADDLDRIRRMETALLAEPHIAGDIELTRALRRHKRVIDRCYYYRAFTDAVKARHVVRAGRLLFEGPHSVGHIAAESMAQAPTIIAKALRGGYARRRAAAG